MPARAAAFLVLAALLTACGGGKDPGKILVATEAAYPPFESKGASGVIEGFDIDLVRAAAREAGLVAEFVDQPFDGIIPGLRQGKYDAAVSAMTITEERAREVDFTDGYYDAGQVIAVRDTEASVRGIEDLKGKVIAVQLGTTGNRAAEKIEKAVVKTFPSIEPAFLELLAGRADAVINDDPTTVLYMREHKGIRIAGKPFTEEKYGIAVRKGNVELLGKLNSGLRKLRETGEYDRLRAKWIGGGGR